MRILTAHLKSISAYSQSRHYDAPKLAREIPKDYESRTWRERLHVNEEGYVGIRSVMTWQGIYVVFGLGQSRHQT